MRQIKVKTIASKIEITGEEAKHLIYSLRSKVGEKITVIDECGKRAIAELINFRKDSVEVSVKEVLPPKKQEIITLAVAIPKRGLDDIIRQATEIGVYAIQPLLTERTVAKPSTAKQERWQRIAKEASQQSGSIEPVIKNLISLEEYLSKITGQIIVCNENEHQQSIADLEISDEVKIIIGCEGGFSEHELNILESAGAVSVTLGENILRVDTAAVVALTMVKFLSRRTELNESAD